MKQLSAALLSGVFAFSAGAANANTLVLSAEPLEVVVTAKRVIVGKNIFDYTVLDNAPEKSVTMVDLHAARNVRTVLPCEDVAKLATGFKEMSPAARLGDALRLVDESHEEYPIKLTISDADGPVDPAKAKEDARLMVAGFTVANFDRAMQRATKICAP